MVYYLYLINFTALCIIYSVLRITKTILVKNPEEVKQNILQWSRQYKTVVCLDSNQHRKEYSNYDCIWAIGAASFIKSSSSSAFSKLKNYQSGIKDWVFGYLTYDLKNDIEALVSNNFDGLEFPELYFFQPKKLFFFKKNEIKISYLKAFENEIDLDIKAITTTASTHFHYIDNIKTTKTPNIIPRVTKDDYLKQVNLILNYIQRGDIYEANFCQEFYCENITIDPLEVYTKLNKASKTPFATYLKLDDKYLLCASPERYLKKDGCNLISQPIKGTAKRCKNKDKDMLLKTNLINDAKERSENIMIVDLVRNDLSKTAIKGSVKVTELCKIYSFEQVHQMISTISAKVSETTQPIDVLKTTFPMGSMTGAPKIAAMKIIERLEKTKRGLYSGAVGYFTPNDDFDFNVVIRSILYNQTKKYASFSVGSAITAKSDPEKEYDECLLKAKAMREALKH